MGVSVITILSAIIVILFFGAMWPSLSYALSTLTNATAGDPVAQGAVGLIPFFLIVAFIIGIFAEGSPTQTQEYY